MNLLNPETTVGRIVAERPESSRLFESLGIDYCCGGKKPLAKACQEKNLDVADVVSKLEAALAAANSACDQRWLEKPMTELIAHILEEHHGFLRREVPRLQFLAEKVARVHGPNHEYLVRLHDVVEVFAAEINAHMPKEEMILFPRIAEAEAGGAEGMGCGLAGPIRQMEHEHDGAGDCLAQMRELTDGFQPPMDACNTWRALYAGLADLESDMHRHVHEENNILFPRALEL